MRPLNTRERRIQFVRFLALFLLAVLPIVLLTWLFGRVDHAENDFLRSNYARNRVQNEASAQYELKLNTLGTKADGLKTWINKKSTAMAKFTGDEKGELENYLDELFDARDDFNKYMKNPGVADSSMIALADHYHTATTKLGEIYGKACEERVALNQALAEAKELLKTQQTENEKLQGQLDLLRGMSR